MTITIWHGLFLVGAFALAVNERYVFAAVLGIVILLSMGII